MPHFKYLAVDDHGRTTKGTIFAEDEWEAEARLERMALAVVRVVPARHREMPAFLARRVSLSELAHFYDRLSDSLGVGLPLATILEENSRNLRHPTLQRVLRSLRLQVEEGNTLAQAMEHHGAIFDSFQRSIVRMGELSGTLPRTLRQLADFLEWQAEQKAQVRRALVYPLVVLGVVFVVAIVWIGYVLPQVSAFLQDMDIPLPAATRFILNASAFLGSWWPLILGLLTAAAVGLAVWVRTETGKLIVSRLSLRIPVLGPLILKLAMCRLCTHFSLMLEAGMSVETIFETLCGGALGNRFLEKDLGRAHREVVAGRTLHEALSAKNIYPDLVLAAFRTGELTGNLSEALERLGQYYDKDVRRDVKALTALFEPASLILLGGTFGAVLLAILLPLYDVFSRIQGF
ncbi:type IV pilus assembly protein PilC [Desulfacinum hydrothermale DSM 13146]|uniref:Type IV pilus assembly protein PilC n=1 Tax=Desulfacinum hydrothermale DSM 13146 TaxID=1121390 RepID=A0A1W1X6E1_9BACT|nr:type II secretion system F family protein [Desulfacinum hydrothermale]SMC19031.1 type IV pilus assembly protein PilC [Desulfacinum hydrothermale DSM 13146]